jgi:hypothetical protein
MENVMTLSKQDKVVDATKQEYAFSTHCMSCDNGKNYQINDDIPESCPVCGEHKEYSIVNMNSLKGNFSVSDWYVCNDCSSHDIGWTDAQESICHSCGSLNIIVE